ncbi:MAG: YbgA family protein [bacterium]
MTEYSKPIVIVSKCLGFSACRYNGVTIYDELIDILKNHVDFRPVCPEIEIGLGVPRDPVRVVSVNNMLRLIQPSTDKDVTNIMNNFAYSFLNSIDKVDGFILKSRSPSCGIKDVKIYPSKDDYRVIRKGSGFFGSAVMDRFPDLPIEDEGRLTNFRIREHFLTKLFIFAKFREIKSSNSMKELVRFHSESKMLLMSYNQKEMRLLGRIVANFEKKPINEVFNDYERHLFNAFKQVPKYMSNINVLMHGLGYFSKNLSHKEKAYFLDILEKYRLKRVPLSVPISILRSYIVRFNQEYLMQQNFFKPYPEDLLEISDSGKGRDL